MTQSKPEPVNLMNERDLLQLLKLLRRFSYVSRKDGSDVFSKEMGLIVNAVLKWIYWYALDELDIDLAVKYSDKNKGR